MMESKTALLIIDVQQGLLEDGPYGASALTDGISRLAQVCREKGVEVLYVRHDDGPGTDLAAGTPRWEIAATLSPAPGERIFDKRRNSAFLNTGLKDYLESHHIHTLILTGMQTEYCIDATCKAGIEHGFSLILPEGAFTTFDCPWLSAQALNEFYTHIWQGRFAQVLPLDEVICFLDKYGAKNF